MRTKTDYILESQAVARDRVRVVDWTGAVDFCGCGGIVESGLGQGC